jgi:hypothetical protein
MRHPSSSNRAFPTVVLALSLVACVPATPARAGTVVPLATFRSVVLRDGGEVILRHGSTQRVTVLEGSLELSSVSIDANGRLVIDRCRDHCPQGYELSVEILTPEIADIMVMNGGTIRSIGEFPQQGELAAAVANGGTIDVRSISADEVAAAVHQGGRILTHPQKALAASIAQGGAITYWGQPRVTSSVDQGGVVARGAAADADKPLEEDGTAVPAVPPVPPVRPTRRGSL